MERQEKVIVTNGQPIMRERRLQQAALHVNHLWFPVNDEVLAKIKKGFAEATYDLDLDFLISEIKGDFSLYMYTLREVLKVAHKEGRTFPENSTPEQVLRLVGLPLLKRVLNVDERRISAHALEKSNDLQTSRLRDAMIAASASEVLCEAEKLDGEMGFSTGLLRELGLTLIAFNYPTVYRRVMTGLADKGDHTVDHAISLALGFSPALLGTVLARQWKLPAVLRRAIGDKDVKVTDEIGRMGDALAKLCEVGEALARANDPEHYPSAAADWESARAVIETRLGFEGIRAIQERVRENCEAYFEAVPNAFKDAVHIDPEAKIHQVIEDALLRTNEYLKACPAPLKKKVKDLYRSINANSVSKETIRTLVREVIPMAGFTAGVVYTLDPALMSLVPRTVIGTPELRDVSSVAYSPGSRAMDPVLAAFECNTPIVENVTAKNSDMVVIASVLGEKQRVGVLYLEAPLDALDEDRQTTLQIFKALRQTLLDCLKIG